MINCVPSINSLDGTWSFLSLLLQITAAIVGYSFLKNRRINLPNLNFTLAVIEVGRGGERVNSDRRLAILIRNLSGIDLLIGSSHVYLKDRTLVSEYADGDNSSGVYELKFRAESDEFTNGFTFLATNKAIETHLSLSEQASLAAEDLITKLSDRKGRRAYISCKVITLAKSPKVFTFKIPLRNIQYRKDGLHKK